MPGVDLPLAELERYQCDESAPADFGQRWASTLAQAREAGWSPRAEAVDSGLRLIRSWDVTFAGYGGDPVKAWLCLPASSGTPLPVVVTYNGYGGGRGLPLEHTTWANAGYAELFMDTRGQGASWGSGGDTPDPHGSGPAAPGWVTRGIESFETLYYRRLQADAARAVDAVRDLAGAELDGVLDPGRVAVAGISQGGGLALAAAGLCEGLVAVMSDVPFLCHIPRGVEVSPTDPYGEITRYLSVHRGQVERVSTTLAYVDGLHHAARASAPALFSVALLDDVCPPSTVYATHRAYGGPKELVVYPHNGHEGGQHHQVSRQLAWMARTCPSPLA